MPAPRASGLTAVLLASAVAALSAQTLPLEQVLSAPFPSSLTAWAGGGRFAWVMNAQGVRNIWVAEAPDDRGRPLTGYTADDGQDLGELSFTPDGSAVLYVRGGAPNRQGELPNPTSDPAGVERAIWIVALAGGAPRRLAEGNAPLASPAGDLVVFLRRGEVWSRALGDTAPARRLFQLRGRPGSLRFSPDGAQLAFVSARGDHAFIGVFHLAQRTLRYLDPSLDRDGNPVWSPDGRQVAFIRIPNERARVPFTPRREAQPWSIRVADAASGIGREVWRAEPRAGSAFWGVEAENQLLWGRGDRLVFPWERDGWLQLYAVPAGGGQAVRLTAGGFEVEHVALSSTGREVIYSSNEGDIDRRHLWRVPVSGGRAEALTRGLGIEWAPAVAGGGTVAFLASDARTPAHPEYLTGSGERRLLAPGAIADGFPRAALVEPQQVIFPAADGLRIHGQLFLPRALKRGDRRPAVLFFHGGSRRQMLLGWHNRGYYHNAYALNQYLASLGFVVVSVNYRSGIGYGMEFREALDYGANGASEFQDVLGAGLYLRGRPDVDPERIGLWGGSYGGYLTALGLARASELFAAGVDLHGVHDWNAVIRNFAPEYDPAARAAVARRAFESSPLAFVHTWRSPVLVIHGDDDRNVPFSETVDLVEQLRRRGVDVEQLVFPDEVHGFLRHASWLRAYAAASEFFVRRLRDRRP